MPSFVESLAELVKLLPQIRELCTRQPSIQEAIVTQDSDPTGFRRVKVTREAQGGQSESDWIPCGRSSAFTDEPIPPPGTHCLVALVGGDPHRPFFLRTLSNQTNPPDEGQLAPTKDNTTRIPGDDRQTIEGNRTVEVSGEQAETVTGDCYLTVDGEKYELSATFGEILLNALAAGVGAIKAESALLSRLASLTDAEVHSGVLTRISSEATVLITQGGGSLQLTGGAWTMSNANGQTWQMGGGSGGDLWRWNLNGAAVQITNCTGFTINGKEVIVVGSTDSDNDVNNTRGY